MNTDTTLIPLPDLLNGFWMATDFAPAELGQHNYFGHENRPFLDHLRFKSFNLSTQIHLPFHVTHFMRVEGKLFQAIQFIH